MNNVWPLIEPLLRDVERPSRYLNHEWGSALKECDLNFCMVYPDTYELGQANQAVRILCNAVNACEHMSAQRAFLPAVDMCDKMREHAIPLFSLEGCNPLCEFDAIGITLPHELAATNVVEILDLSGISLLAEERSEGEPFVLGGGPCALNPEPYALFFDAFTIGEGEEAVPELLAVIREQRAKGASRADILHALAQVPGTYVPLLYEDVADVASGAVAAVVPCAPSVPATVLKRVYAGFAQSSGWEPCIVPYAEVSHDRVNVEVLRGCARGCRFCQAGMMYRPVRERNAKDIVLSAVRGLAETGHDEVSLTSLSTTDHSQIREILQQLNAACENKGIRISIPSQRLDSFGVDMAHLVAGQKKGGLTFAPEAGTQRLRDVINKNVTEDDLFGAVDAAFAAGWRRCKLYFMIGLPTETDDDIRGIADVAMRVYDRARTIVPPDQKGAVQIGVSVALFVPKPQTPFQWCEQISREEALRRVNVLRSACRIRAIRVTWHDPATSALEAVLARGDRSVGRLILEAWKAGARFDAWTELYSQEAWDSAERTCGVSVDELACRPLSFDAPLPWAHISCGVSTDFLRREYERALQGVTTPDCTFESCSGCGACQALAMHNELAEVRHG